jgi:hypothetical protein
MTQEHDHPITPPIELLRRLREEAPKCPDQGVITLEEWVAREVARQEWIATQAARWGADQELEACCEWIGSEGLAGYTSRELRAARRPKPPSLKEQSLKHLEVMERDGLYLPEILQDLRRALELITDD